MKKINLVLSVLVLLLVLFGCDKNPADVKEKDPDGVLGGEEPKPELTTLFNTKWKLVGFFDIERNELVEAEPRDCEECYTLTFETDSTLLTFSSSNELYGSYTIDNETSSFQVVSFGGTKVVESYHGDLYASIFWDKKLQFFSLKEDELSLFYNDKKNCLLFKEIK